MSRLLRAAHEEASRPLQDHIALQEALQTLGFLNSNTDGMYGPETRWAIIQWQRSKELPLTGLLDNAAGDALAPFANRTTANVIGCYNDATYSNAKKLITIQEMRNCAGVWVTPRALLLCVMGSTCPVLADTADGRAMLDATLTKESLKPSDQLVLRSKDLPMSGPQQFEALARCRQNAISEQAFVSCVVDASGPPAYKAMKGCFEDPSDRNRSACLASQVPDPTLTNALVCIGNDRPTAEKLLRFTDTFQQDAAAAQIRQCIDAAATIEKARACTTAALGSDASRVNGCLANADRSTLAICLLGDKPALRATQRVYECVAAGRDTSSVIVNCTGDLFDAKTRVTLSCVSQAGNDKEKLGACAAAAVLPSKQAQLVSCAATSDGATSFTLCAAAPSMSEEWRIAAECAVESGGVPVAFAGCTATRLTVRELTKCFTGQFGRDCYGPNNTIVKTVNTAFKDVLHGAGENNDAVKSFAAISEVVKNVGQQANGAIQHLGQEVPKLVPNSNIKIPPLPPIPVPCEAQVKCSGDLLDGSLHCENTCQ
jgi:putative peptidoglycan binding protein